MRYELTFHARKRMKERVISEKLIQDALRLPTKVSVDQDGTWLYKKTYT
jgi:hypothetical protein